MHPDRHRRFEAIAGEVFDPLQRYLRRRMDAEDAADAFSAYVMLQLGKSEARRLIAGTAYAYATEVKAATTPPKLKDFADEHGTPAELANAIAAARGVIARKTVTLNFMTR